MSADKKQRCPVIHGGEAVLGELSPGSYAGISSQGEVLPRRAGATSLIKQGTEEQAPSRATGT